jgi:hypothetical protein
VLSNVKIIKNVPSQHKCTNIFTIGHWDQQRNVDQTICVRTISLATLVLAQLKNVHACLRRRLRDLGDAWEIRSNDDSFRKIFNFNILNAEKSTSPSLPLPLSLSLSLSLYSSRTLSLSLHSSRLIPLRISLVSLSPCCSRSLSLFSRP